MAGRAPHIDDYAFGRITIDGRVYTEDLFLSATGVSTGWWRKAGHSLCPEDLPQIREQRPDLLIIGCGASSALSVPPATRDWIKNQGIELAAVATPQACELFNRRVLESTAVMAGFHLTC